MANKILWDASPTSRGTGLTTELNSLANDAYSAVGTAFDNTTNSDKYASAEINLASLTPTTGAFLTLYMVQSLDGTNYEDAPSSTNPGLDKIVWQGYVSTGVGAKRVSTQPFLIPPGKFKFVLRNDTNVALGASGNTVTIYTNDDEIQ